ncbi:hypothetical protein ACI3EY_07955 [Ornithinimicrobium sp. LYQ92]|uniref:DUF7341 domain-containing protein n=1 Tax=Serinicoccus sp. LYQ92 TaxID=3378798 RepID=UPI0038547706
MTRPELLAADHIRELVQSHTNTERITRDDGTTSIHAVTHPPLLDQLQQATTGSSNLSDDNAGTRFGSKPAGHLEALDLLARIDRQSAALGDVHGIDEPHLTKRLIRLSGFIGHRPDRQVKAWWSAARVITHWDSPAYRPHGTPCPACWDTGTLRIRIDEEIGHCTGCGETWDATGSPDTPPLGLLAQHVRWCSDHEVTKPRHWLLDDGGFPVECTECLDFREAWASWRAGQTEAVARGA